MTETNGSNQNSGETATIRIFVPPVSECASDNTWENAVEGIKQRLLRRFDGASFRIEVVYLFSPEFFGYPDVMQLVESGEGKPAIVTINGRIIQKEGKLSERVIRQELEHLGVPTRSAG